MYERTIESEGSSPHTRGAPVQYSVYKEDSRIIPAYAGSTFSFPVPGAFLPDHPRIRGEHLLNVGKKIIGGGSSPHTRGAPILVILIAVVARIIPAYAGSTETDDDIRVYY